jgi:DNA-binding IclR family transcriptional regulator
MAFIIMVRNPLSRCESPSQRQSLMIRPCGLGNSISTDQRCGVFGSFGHCMVKKRQNTVRSVERAMSLMKLIGMADGPVSLTSLAHQTDLHPATAHRLLQSLAEVGFVEQDPESSLYGPGAGFLSLALAQERRLTLAALSRSVLQQLVEETGETAGLARRDGANTVIIARALSPHALRVHTPIGGLGPLHATAVGLVLLAHMSGDARSALLSGPLRKFTARTITDPKVIERTLDAIRRDGYAVADGDLHEGVANIGAPVRDADMSVVAAVSISGPSDRILGDSRDAHIESVVRSGEEVSRLLGHADARD